MYTFFMLENMMEWLVTNENKHMLTYKLHWLGVHETVQIHFDILLGNDTQYYVTEPPKKINLSGVQKKYLNAVDCEFVNTFVCRSRERSIE